jgi:hypothetical protein
LILVQGNNKVVFFYPSPYGAHKFTKTQYELPFDKVVPNGLIEIDFGRILIFPKENGKYGFLDVYLAETMESQDIEGFGLITKCQSMLKQRVQSIFVKVWSNLLYAIGGAGEGQCERFDVNLNQWKQIASFPEPTTLQYYQGANVLEKYVYLVG